MGVTLCVYVCMWFGKLGEAGVLVLEVVRFEISDNYVVLIVSDMHEVHTGHKRNHQELISLQICKHICITWQRQR